MLKHGSLLGASLLIAGCCIGAGMLGLPAATIKAGFFPSIATFLFSWLYMTIAGLVFLEVALRFPDETNMAEMAKKYLGPLGQGLAFFLMLFLMYSVMTAYAAASGPLISSYFPIEPETGSFLFALVLYLSLMIGTFALDYFNRLFMIGLGITYIGLVILGFPFVKNSNLIITNWNEAFFIAPIMIVSFGFHNLIPSLVRYLNRDPVLLRLAILIGTTLPLFVYLLWEYIILGIADPYTQNPQMASDLLKGVSGYLGWVEHLVIAFSFFAITTSFMGNALSVLDFLLDQSKRPNLRWLFALITVLPPLIVAYYNPNIFLNALNFAGSFSATLLFGILPALMWILGRGEKSTYKIRGGMAASIFLVFAGIVIMVLSNFYHLF